MKDSFSSYEILGRQAFHYLRPSFTKKSFQVAKRALTLRQVVTGLLLRNGRAVDVSDMAIKEAWPAAVEDASQLKRVRQLLNERVV